jgi:hypothetical protein
MSGKSIEDMPSPLRLFLTALPVSVRKKRSQSTRAVARGKIGPQFYLFESRFFVSVSPFVVVSHS